MINKLFIAAVLLATVSVSAAETSAPEEVKRLELQPDKSPTETIRLEFDTPVSLTADQKKEIEWGLALSLKANLRFIRLEVLDSGGKVRFRCDTPGNISLRDAAGKPVGNTLAFSVMTFSEPNADGKNLRLYGLNYEIVEGMPEWEKGFPETLKKIEELNKADFRKPPVKLLSVKKAEDFFAKTKKLKTDMTSNEVIAILGPPDRTQTPGPKKLLPSGPAVTVRYLYYFLYRNGYSPSPEEIFVVLQLDYPDYPSRRRTALKALYMDDEAHYILNTAVPAPPRGSGNRGMGVRNYVVEKRKIALPDPRRIQVDGKTTAILFPRSRMSTITGSYPFTDQDFLIRMIPEIHCGTGGFYYSSDGDKLLSTGKAGDAPDRLLLNPDGSKRKYPFRLEWLKEENDLEELDLSLLSQVELDSTRLPKLRVLKVDGQISGLEKLDLPALETLEISGRPQPPDGEFRMNVSYRTGTPTFPDAPPLRLSRNLPKLKKFVLKGNPGDFDFSTLSGRSLESVYLPPCTTAQITALRGQKVRELTFSLSGKEDPKPVAELLAAFPLEKLQFAGELKDYSFLKNKKLRELFLRPTGDEEAFNPEWLRGQPLEKMTIFGAFGDKFTDWKVLQSMPSLRELIFIGAGIADPAAFAGLPVEKLSFQQCYFQKPEVLEAVARMPNLQMLSIGRIGHIPPGNQRKGSDLNDNLPWEKLSNLPLKAFSYWGNRSDFLQSFQSLEYLKITVVSKEEAFQVDDVKCAKPLKMLVLNKGFGKTRERPEPVEYGAGRNQPPRKPEIAERIIVNSPSLFFF